MSFDIQRLFPNPAPPVVFLGPPPPPPPAPPAPPLPAPAPPIDPKEFSATLYDKGIPAALGGTLQFGGRIIEGPGNGDGTIYHVIDNEPCASFVVGYYIPINFWSATRTVTKLSFRGKESWDSTSGASMSGLYVGVPTTGDQQTVRFTTGTLDQAADAWSVSKFGIDNAIGYIPLVTATFENIRLAQFGGLIPFTSVTVEDTYFGDPADNVLWSEALDAIARYDGRTTDEFESIDVSGSVAGIIFGSKLTFPEFLAGMRKHKPQWNIRTGSKLYVVEKGVFSLDLTLDRSDNATWFVVENAAAPVVIHGGDAFDNPREMLANFIDVSRDYEPNVARAAEDLEPVPSTDAFDSDSYNLPVVSTAPEVLSEVNFAFYSQDMAREKSEFSGQAPYMGLEPGDTYKIVTDEMDYFHRANEIVRKANYTVDVKGEGFLTCAIAVSEEDYVTGAVHFDGTVDISTASLSCTDSPAYAVSFYVRVANSSIYNGILTVVDPTGHYYSYTELTAAHFVELTLDDADTGSGLLRFNATNPPANDTWLHVIASADETAGYPGNKMKIYIDGVDVTTVVGGGPVPSGSNLLFNGLGLHIGDDTFGDGLVADIAELWIAPGQSLLDGSGDIPPATIAKFRNAVTGKPVDLGSDGSTPTGVAPAVYMRGYASTFATNLGTGGSFTTSGVLTDASSSPSD